MDLIERRRLEVEGRTLRGTGAQQNIEIPFLTTAGGRIVRVRAELAGHHMVLRSDWIDQRKHAGEALAFVLNGGRTNRRGCHGCCERRQCDHNLGQTGADGYSKRHSGSRQCAVFLCLRRHGASHLDMNSLKLTNRRSATLPRLTAVYIQDRLFTITAAADGEGWGDGSAAAQDFRRVLDPPSRL